MCPGAVFYRNVLHPPLHQTLLHEHHEILNRNTLQIPLLAFLYQCWILGATKFGVVESFTLPDVPSKPPVISLITVLKLALFRMSHFLLADSVCATQAAVVLNLFKHVGHMTSPPAWTEVRRCSWKSRARLNLRLHRYPGQTYCCWTASQKRSTPVMEEVAEMIEFAGSVTIWLYPWFELEWTTEGSG